MPSGTILFIINNLILINNFSPPLTFLVLGHGKAGSYLMPVS